MIHKKSDEQIKSVFQEIEIDLNQLKLKGLLHVPHEATGIVLFAHGSGSGRHSPRNQFVAESLNEAGLGILLMDLLTEKEETIEDASGELRFNIPFLGERLMAITLWLETQPLLKELSCGYFGASTGAAAALTAAAQMSSQIKAVVSRGGRPDLAGPHLSKVISPTLLIVGGNDEVVIELNRKAFELLSCEKRLEIIPGASHLFEEPGTLMQAAHLAAFWFNRFL